MSPAERGNPTAITDAQQGVRRQQALQAWRWTDFLHNMIVMGQKGMAPFRSLQNNSAFAHQ